MATWLGKWDGGRVRQGTNGEPVYVIECMRLGERYVITLDAVHGEKAALAEWALFERNPAAYRDAARNRVRVVSTPTDGVRIDSDTIAEYQRDVLEGPEEHRISPKQCKDNVRYLKRWMLALGGRDLRQLTLRDYRLELKKLEPRRHHIAALRAFTHWLRREGRLGSHEDASRDLEVPQSGTSLESNPDPVAIEDFEKIYAHIRARPKARADRAREEPELAQGARDVVVLRILTGMHYTEVQRIALGGGKIEPVSGHGEIAGVVSFRHKRGNDHRQSVPEQALRAALRIQERGYIPGENYINAQLRESAKEAGVEPVEGWRFRSAFITWGIEVGRPVYPKAGGVPVEFIAMTVNHGSTEMIKRHYNRSKIPPMVLLPLKLENPEDPK